MPPIVHGIDLDANTRCQHYHGPLDIVAIKMYCCQEYYACISCHNELADHPAQPWPLQERQTPAVLCGACSHEMTIQTYLHTSKCPACHAPFNPRCSLHYPLYFEMP
ncbi:MAG: hypothetical protein HRU40_10975 [Saprospiraceae bacterium]|nr:hypothetical protein [Saprospiraceae bacterium]